MPECSFAKKKKKGQVHHSSMYANKSHALLFGSTTGNILRIKEQPTTIFSNTSMQGTFKLHA